MNRKEYIKEYHILNKEKIKQQKAEYYKNNKEKIKLKYDKQKAKKYYKFNEEKIKKQVQIYYNNNKEVILEKAYKHRKQRCKYDNLFKLRLNIRSLICLSIKKKGYLKNSKTEQILGCSFEEFKAHIESQWKPWMSWDNYGLYNGTENYGWDIDHIIPTSSAKTEEDLYNLNHYTNLQPLCSYVNRVIKKDN